VEKHISAGRPVVERSGEVGMHTTGTTVETWYGFCANSYASPLQSDNSVMLRTLPHCAWWRQAYKNAASNLLAGTMGVRDEP